jgi:hypothetical protein
MVCFASTEHRTGGRVQAEWREAWQSMSLGGAGPPHQGKLSVPQPWLKPALWAP